MPLSEYDRSVIKSFTKWRKEQTQELRERRSAAVRRFLQKVKDGTDPIVAKKEIGEIYNFSPRQMEGIISGRYLLTKEGAQDRQVTINRIIDRAERQLEMIADDMQDCLEDIAQAERDGVEMYELEYENSVGDKGTVSKTKSVPLDEARFLVRNRYLSQLKSFTSMIKDLCPDYVFNTNVYNVNQKEVEDEIRALIGKNRLNDSVFKEQK